MRGAPLRTRLAVLAFTAASSSLAAWPVRADDTKTEAAKSFHIGSEAYAKRDYKTAADAFEEAYRIAPKAAAAYNAGLSREGAGERCKAADDYTQALEATDLGAAERADSTGRLRAIEREVGRVSLSAPPGTKLTLDDVALPGSSADLHVEAGRHELRVAYGDGRAETRTITARPSVTVTMKLGDTSSEAPPPTETPIDTSSDTERESPRPSHAERGETPSPPSGPDRTATWALFGGAGAAAGIALVTFGIGITARNEFVKDGDKNPSLRNQALALRTTSWVAWGLAGGLAATGLVLYLATPGDTSASTGGSSASLALDARGVTLRVGF
jgi:tetratricopeptide (TPR) repeat protein